MCQGKVGVRGLPARPPIASQTRAASKLATRSGSVFTHETGAPSGCVLPRAALSPRSTTTTTTIDEVASRAAIPCSLRRCHSLQYESTRGHRQHPCRAKRRRDRDVESAAVGRKLRQYGFLPHHSSRRCCVRDRPHARSALRTRQSHRPRSILPISRTRIHLCRLLPYSIAWVFGLRVHSSSSAVFACCSYCKPAALPRVTAADRRTRRPGSRAAA